MQNTVRVQDRLTVVVPWHKSVESELENEGVVDSRVVGFSQSLQTKLAVFPTQGPFRGDVFAAKPKSALLANKYVTSGLTFVLQDERVLCYA